VLGLLGDLFADRRQGYLAGKALEDLNAKFIFQLLDGDAEGRLADKTCLCGMAEVPFPRYSHDVA
jgi:hypothetical protein